MTASGLGSLWQLQLYRLPRSQSFSTGHPTWKKISAHSLYFILGESAGGQTRFVQVNISMLPTKWAENPRAVGNVTIVQLQTHSLLLSFVMLGQGLCKPTTLLFSQPPVKLYLQEAQKKTRRAEREKEIALSCLPSLSVSITLAVTPGPVSNFFYTFSISIIVLNSPQSQFTQVKSQLNYLVDLC